MELKSNQWILNSYNHLKENGLCSRFILGTSIYYILQKTYNKLMTNVYEDCVQVREWN